MNNYFFIIATLFFSSLSYSSHSQEDTGQEFSFEINRVLRPLSISKDQLLKSETISDLNRHFKPSWVAQYINVDVITIAQGHEKTASGSNEFLTSEQKENLRSSDANSDITISVIYIPNNILINNEPKEMKFSFIVDPETEASYSGGSDNLRTYIKSNAVDKLDWTILDDYQLVAIKFTVDEVGQITNAHVFESSKNKEIDERLLQVICNMDIWKPAEYDSGLNITQDFMLTVGDMRSCIVNTLGIYR